MIKLIKSTLLLLSGVLALNSCAKENVVEEPVKMTVTFEAASNGVVDPSGDQTGNMGSTLFSVAAGNANYSLEGWYDGETKIKGTEDILLVGDTLRVKLTERTARKKFEARFADSKYTVKIKNLSSEGGSVSPDSCVAKVNTPFEFTATPEQEYGVFWYDDLGNSITSTDTSLPIYLSADGLHLFVLSSSEVDGKTFQVAFIKNGYTVNFEVDGEGGFVSQSVGTEPAGEMIECDAIPDTDYILEGWYDPANKKIDATEGDIYVSGETLYVKSSSDVNDHTFVAKFMLKEYTVKIKNLSPGGGTVSPADSCVAVAGDTIQFAATPGSTYGAFWTDYLGERITSTDTSSPYYLSADSLMLFVKSSSEVDGKTFQVAFEEKFYTVKFRSEAGGSVGQSASSTLVGKMIECDAIPDADYKLEGWYNSDDQKIDATEGDIYVSGETLHVKSSSDVNNHTFVAKFTLKEYTVKIKITSPEGGTVSPADSCVAVAGNTIQFTATPKQDYRISWTDYLGERITSTDTSSPYYLSADSLMLFVKSSSAVDGKTFHAAFIKNDYRVNFAVDGEGGSVSQSIGIKPAGEMIECAAMPGVDYILEGWYDPANKKIDATEGDIYVSGEKLYVKSTSGVNGQTFVAKFKLKEYTVTLESDAPRGADGTVDNVGGTADAGTKIASTASIPIDGYKFYAWFDGESMITSESTSDDLYLTNGGKTLNVTYSSATDSKTYTAKYVLDVDIKGGEMSFTVTPSRGEGLKCYLPFTKEGTTGAYTLFVNWGDESAINVIRPNTPLNDGVMHVYEQEGEFTITITSSEDDFKNVQVPRINFSNFNSTRIALKAVNTPLLNAGTDNFSDVFSMCSNLTGVPIDLFRYNTAVTNFSSAFKNCSKLTEVPADLFRYNTAVT
ncbi:MAG: InlB B-repeat-containing protein, partial [Phocaeicola sp.]